MTQRRTRVVTVRDQMQEGYRYELTASRGRDFHPDFRPELTPKQMLALGVFCGKYMTDCRNEFPAAWFAQAKLSPERRDVAQKGLDLPRRSARLVPMVLPLLMGRRIPEEDSRQIRRWKAMRRHVAQIKRHCEHRDQTCRKRQRRALLHWAYDSRKI